MTKVNEFKKENIQSVRECFYQGEILTKELIKESTGLSNASLVNILSYLLDNKEIKQIDDAKSTGGRKKKQYVLNPEHAYILKVYLHKEKKVYVFDVCTCNLNDDVIQQETMRSSKGSVDELFSMLDECITSKVKMICVSIPGICKDGIIRECDFKQFENVDLGKQLKREYKIPYVIENDVNVALIGCQKEYKDIQDMVFIYQPQQDYLGCGILIGGKLYNGYKHAAGELRFLPDKTLKQQDEENKEHPKEFLENRIQIMKAVLDPEMVLVASSLCDVSTIKDITPIKNMDEMILKGLFNISLHNLGGKEYVR